MGLLINVDAGHGSNTAGKRTPAIPINLDSNRDGKIDFQKGETIREHCANVPCAYYYSKYLKQYGIATMKTGWNDLNAKDDPDVVLSARQQLIKKAKADLTVSWHWNAFGSSFNEANGIEVLYHCNSQKVGDSKSFATAVIKELVKGTRQSNRGIKTQELAMCNCQAMGTKAAILIECGFMTNLLEAKLMASQEFWEECAKEAVKGTINYLTGGIPAKPINKQSGKKSIYWLQMMLNRYAGAKLIVDGGYGERTKKAVIKYWGILGWNKDGSSNGWTAGAKTIKALQSGRR